LAESSEEILPLGAATFPEMGTVLDGSGVEVVGVEDEELPPPPPLPPHESKIADKKA
jgi:hypothetical protein